MVCPTCGLWNPQRNTTCESCGAVLSSPGGSPPAAPLLPPVDPQAGIAAAVAAAFPAASLPGHSAPPQPLPPPTESPPIPRARFDEPSLYAPVLGPADRESFFAAQRRHRRATWRLTAGSAVAAIVSGIPLSLILTPVIFAAILILTRLLHIVVPVPDAVWDAYRSTGLVLGDVIEAMDDPSTPGVEEGDLGNVPISLFLKAAGIWLLPGVVLMLIVWPVLMRLFRHGGVGGVLLSIGARPPVMTDLEERQLVNIIEEMAIAAGLPPPRVMLLDSNVANAAAVGSSPEDATIVVSRALLDDLNRDQTQGILGHLVASIGNGDLRAAMSIVAIFQTFGFAAALVKAPISGPARATVRKMLGYVFSRHKPHERAEEARVVSEMLTTGIWEMEEDDFSAINDDSKEPRERPGPSLRLLLYFPIFFIAVFVATLLLEFPDPLRRLTMVGVVGLALLLIWYQREYAAYQFVFAAKMARFIVMLPYYIGAMMPQFMLQMLASFILEPLLAMLWRTRRYLADATAVQLTRQPDFVARGLTGLVERGGIIPGGRWAGPLFIVGPEAATRRMTSAMQAQYAGYLEEARNKGKEAGQHGIMGEARAYIEAQREMAGAAQAAERADGAPAQPAVFALANAYAEASGAHQDAGFAVGGDSSVVSFHPPLAKRLKKLRRLGASVDETEMASSPAIPGTPTTNKTSLLGYLLKPVFAFLLLLVPLLMLVAFTLLGLLALGACAILMAMVYGLFQLIVPT